MIAYSLSSIHCWVFCTIVEHLSTNTCPCFHGYFICPCGLSTCQSSISFTYCSSQILYSSLLDLPRPQLSLFLCSHHSLAIRSIVHIVPYFPHLSLILLPLHSWLHVLICPITFQHQLYSHQFRLIWHTLPRHFPQYTRQLHSTMYPPCHQMFPLVLIVSPLPFHIRPPSHSLLLNSTIFINFLPIDCIFSLYAF